MRKFICDRCKAEAEAPSDAYSPWIHMWDTVKGYDLCPECMREFRESFMGIPPESDPAQRTLDGPDEPWNSQAAEGQGAER